MLDRTVVLYGSGMNSGKGGEHSPKNLPTLVAGGRGLGIKTVNTLRSTKRSTRRCRTRSWRSRRNSAWNPTNSRTRRGL